MPGIDVWDWLLPLAFPIGLFSLYVLYLRRARRYAWGEIAGLFMWVMLLMGFFIFGLPWLADLFGFR